jgi:AbiV family abortive infection protein
MSKPTLSSTLEIASRLIGDAAYLADGNRYESAFNLAVLALEQVGRALLISEQNFDPAAKDKHKQGLNRGVLYLSQSGAYTKDLPQLIADVVRQMQFSKSKKRMVDAFIAAVESSQPLESYENEFFQIVSMIGETADLFSIAMSRKRYVLHQQRLSYLYGDPLPVDVPNLYRDECDGLITDVKAAIENLRDDIKHGWLTRSHATDDAVLPEEKNEND